MPRHASARRVAAATLAALALHATAVLPLAAQLVAADSLPVAAPVSAAGPTLGPTLDGARAGARVGPRAGATRAAHDSAATDATAAVPVAGPRAGRPVALMAVGAAALVIGLLIGGNGGKAVAVGGAVVGLAGLYEFIR